MLLHNQMSIASVENIKMGKDHKYSNFRFLTWASGYTIKLYLNKQACKKSIVTRYFTKKKEFFMGKTPLNRREDRFLKIIYAENNKFYPLRKDSMTMNPITKNKTFLQIPYLIVVNY